MNKKRIGFLSATFLGISSIIGSGWLFAPYNAASVAGPAALASWGIGAIVIIFLALCFAEVASLYPKRGLSAIIPTLSHNKFFGFPFAIANWLGIIAVIGLEADATIQYLINLFPKIESIFFSHGQLSLYGNTLSITLVLLYSLVNYWGAKTMTRTNNVLVVLKVIVPVVVSLIIIGVAFHPGNFKLVGHSYVPYGFGSIISGILSTGIIIAFNGFQTVISFASEIKKPQRTIPLSLIVSVVFCLGVYLLLQVAFIGSIPATALTHGWHQLTMHAPMVQLSVMLGLGLLTSIIYFGATIAPTGTAITFVGTSTRMFTAMSRNGQMPKQFDSVHPKYGVSRPSLVVNTILAILFLLAFRSWGQLAQVLSIFHVISYLPIPIALCVFRNCMKHDKYPFLLPAGKSIAFVLFAIFTFLITMGNVSTVADILGIFGACQLAFIAFNVKSIDELLSAVRQCSLLLVYFAGLYVLTAISPLHSSYLSDTSFAILLIAFISLSFIGLIKFENNDRAIIESSVNIYNSDAKA